MKVTFEANNEVFQLDVRESANIKEGCSGYRLRNCILLSKEVFCEWASALKVDDFARLKSIVDSLLDFESYQLQSFTENRQLNKPY